jgi:hypothetical protein
MEQDSSLSSIVPTYPGAVPLRRLHETESLAGLHADFWPKSMKELNNESMNDAVDDEDTTDGDGDIGSGYLCIPDIDAKIWVRKEYIRLYDYCNEFFKSESANKKPISVVITGQPGIGECFRVASWFC